MNRIPKIIHQIWIGPNPAPLACMNTWLNKNPDFEYIFWNEQEFERRGIQFEAQEKIDMLSEYSGKTDIMRIEILDRFGGIFIDADSICIEPLAELFERLANSTGFATFENESFRKGLIANGNLAVSSKHPILRDMLDWIMSPAANEPIRTLRAWAAVGPVLLTRFLETGKYGGFTVLPSYYFLPIHFTGTSYMGHRKVYAHQLWGSNYNLYENTELTVELPQCLTTPFSKINIFIDLNIDGNNGQTISEGGFLKQFTLLLESLKMQNGYFFMDISIFLEDNIIFERFYMEIFENFERTSRFCVINRKSNINEKNNEEQILENSRPYILIPPISILYPDTIEKIIGGSQITVKSGQGNTLLSIIN